MPRKSKRQKRKSANPFKHASKQGMGSTEDWKINDLSVCVLSQDVNPGFYTVRVACDCNGFSWTVSDAGVVVAQFPGATYFQYNQAYGTANNQFSRLSLLWEQYRVNWIEMEVIPSGASGFMNTTGIFSLVDEADLLNGKEPLGDLVPKLSSQRSLDMHTPYKVVKKRLDLSKWIGQTQDTAWLQTQQADTTQLIREQYKTQWVDPANNAPRATTPALCMVFGVNTLQSVQTVIASIRFSCGFSFRQRAALDNNPVFGRTVVYRMDSDGREYREVTKQDDEDEEGDRTRIDSMSAMTLPPRPSQLTESPAVSITKSTFDRLFSKQSTD